MKDLSSKKLLERMYAYRDKLEASNTVKHKEFVVMCAALLGVKMIIQDLLNSEQEDERSVATDDQSGNKSL